jgi:DNA (cytosine-5)-methyltransferase 1
MKTLTFNDFFAGGGGFTEGADQGGAVGRLAANHNPVAVQIHQLNHPDMQHITQDLNLIDWNGVPKADIFLASPCCQGFTRARGKHQPRHDVSRQTAWCVPHGLEFHRPRFLVIENVVDIMQWDRYAIWKKTIESFGYRLTENILNAADFGVPQSRERLFLVGALDQTVEISVPRRKHQTARQVIQWSRGPWQPIAKKIASKTILRQIHNGRRLYGDRFLVIYNGAEQNGRSLDRPMPTVTANDRIRIVDGDHSRLLSVDEAKIAMGFPARYVMPSQHAVGLELLGNAVCPPVAQEIIQQIGRAA